MNRQTWVDSVDSAGNLGLHGHAITYDLNNHVSTIAHDATVLQKLDYDGAVRARSQSFQ